MVISAHVKGSKRINLSNNLTGTFKKISPSQADKCVFWDFAKNGQCFCFAMHLFRQPFIRPFASFSFSCSVSFNVG